MNSDFTVAYFTQPLSGEAAIGGGTKMFWGGLQTFFINNLLPKIIIDNLRILDQAIVKRPKLV